MKKVLGINPHFYDFSAFDFWAKPLGFLYLMAILKNLGWGVDFIDCLDRNHPALANFFGKFKRTKTYGTGSYYFEKVPQPVILADVPLVYKRFGLPEEIFRGQLEKIKPPDLILVTSGMTYWYSGVFEAIKILKEIFPGVPVVLGGTYTTLMLAHARRFSGADEVFGGRLNEFFKWLEAEFGTFMQNPPAAFCDFPAPDFSFYKNPDYVILKTGQGCPFSCTYCAVRKISPQIFKKPLEKVISEIEYFFRNGIKNLAFYDDALLYPPEYFENLLEEIQRRKIKMFFHTSNGLHASFVTEKMASLMKENNFVLPRLSLETADAGRQAATGGKVTNADFERAIFYLRAAGYRPGEIGVYLMMGLPGQSFEEVEESLRYAHHLGGRITLAEYSPVPGTPDFKKSGLQNKDPLLHNNSIYPLYPRKDWEKFQALKDLVKILNQEF